MSPWGISTWEGFFLLTKSNTMIQLYHMNYVTTNIRISEEDYLRLKAEAAKKRKSLSAVIRNKLKAKESKKLSAEQLMKRIEKHARENAKYHVKGMDSAKIFREMRYKAKW